MAEQTVQELVVAMSSEGTESTSDDLDEAGDTFEKTAEQSEDSSEAISKNADVWDRAMGVIITGLTVAAAGLLSQVPIIGEVFDGLFAVIEALAFQIDNVLRPIIGPVRDDLFALSGAIFQAENAGQILMAFVDHFVATLTILGVVLGSVLASMFALVGVSSTLGAIKTAVVAVVGALVAVIGGPLLLALGALAAGIALTWLAWENNWLGSRERVIGLFHLFRDLIDNLIGWFGDLKDDTMEIFGALASDLRTWWDNLKADTETIVSALIDDMKEWGRDLIDAFIEGITAAAGAITATIDAQVTQRVEGTMVGQLLGAAGQTVNMEPRDMVTAPDRSSNIIQIDGQDVTSSLGRFRKDGALGRGSQ